MKRTTAPGSSGGQYVDDNPALGVIGTLNIAEDRNGTQEEICAPIEGAGLTLSGTDTAQLWKAMRKVIKERSREVGEIFTLLDKKAPVAFGTGTEDTYFPGLCLTDIASYVDISATNWPDLVPKLRAVKAIFKDGITGEIASPGVTAWEIAANVATLTFTNDTDHIAFLAALAEDQAVHASFTNWRTITLASAIGNISAGTYAITAISSSSRTISFAFTASDSSGSVTTTAEFYPHRVAGSANTARVFSARGLTVHGANDDNGYFMAGGLRRRDFMQGHFHAYKALLYSPPAGSSAYCLTNIGDGSNEIRSPTTDGDNGTPRTGKTTHGPAITVHIYMHGGSYVA